MASLDVQIAVAMEARLKLASVTLPSGVKTPPAGLTVVREKLNTIYPGDVRSGPMLVISGSGQPSISRKQWSSPVTQRVIEYLVSVHALAEDEKGLESTDDAYLWLIWALQSDQSLGGLANYISEEGVDIAYTAFQDSSEIIAAREVKIWVYTHSRTDDPEVRANA